jgi:hypothetical protein
MRYATQHTLIRPLLVVFVIWELEVFFRASGKYIETLGFKVRNVSNLLA